MLAHPNSIFTYLQWKHALKTDWNQEGSSHEFKCKYIQGTDSERNVKQDFYIILKEKMRRPFFKLILTSYNDEVHHLHICANWSDWLNLSFD